MYSVIIPCFNSSKTLITALNSVVMQTIKPLDICIVDDCSSDGTLEVARKFKEDFTEIQIKIKILSKNSGAATARNFAIGMAETNLLAFLDADDEWHNSKMEIQLGIMKRLKLDILGSLVYAFQDETLETHLKEYSEPPQINSLKTDSLSLRSMLFSNKLITPSVVMRKEINLCFNENLRYAEDFDLWLRILSSKKRAGLVLYPLVKLAKPSFGASGLSSHLLKMELGEMKAIFNCFSYAPVTVIFSLIYSILKFFRRVLVVWIRK